MLFLGALVGGAGVGALFWISQDLPRVDRVTDYRPPAVTQVLAADGGLMGEFFRQRRYVIPMKQIPRHTQLAFVAAEDGQFYQHVGVDLWGILRAAIANLRAGRVVQGGSTITQQVARGLLLTPKRTITRKLKEMILAWRMERALTKDEILFLYLNQIYLGHGAYGIQAAARSYFGKDASQLDVAESALLAGLVQAPSRYSPLRHPRRARTRQVYVLQRMAAEGFISQEKAQQAMNEQVQFAEDSRERVNAPYYTEYVRQWLEELVGAEQLYEGGLTVYTACNPRLTAAAQTAIKQGLAELSRRQGWRGPVGQLTPAELASWRERPAADDGLEPGQEHKAAVVAIDGQGQPRLRVAGARARLDQEDLAWIKRGGKKQPGRSLKPGELILVRLVSRDGKSGLWQTKLVVRPMAQSAVLCLDSDTGRVRVAVGGRDFSVSQYNRAIQARRQPGSAFKPFIYSAALDHPVRSYTPSSVIIDAPVVFDDPSRPGEKWKPKNYENRFYGPTTLRSALEHSRNVVTIKLLAELGIGYVTDYARRFGFTSPLVPNLSLALGTSGLSLLELTRAYSVFDNGGLLVEPVFVEKVLDRHGDVIYKARRQVTEAISPQTAFIMTHLLRGVVEYGTGRRMRALGRPVAGKTGTTNDLRDAWFVGFTPRLICGVWVGQDDNEPLGRRETGARAAGPIWLSFMQKATEGTPPADFPVPPGVVFAQVDKDTGEPLAPGDGRQGFFEAYKEGTQPTPGSRHDEQPGTPSPVQEFMEAESFANGGHQDKPHAH